MHFYLIQFVTFFFPFSFCCYRFFFWWTKIFNPAGMELNGMATSLLNLMQQFTHQCG